MTDMLIAQIREEFKSAYGLNMGSSSEMFHTERNVLDFLMGLGRRMMGAAFQEMDGGYRGPVIEHEGKRYTFVGYRSVSLHGLFGMVAYTRAYYYSDARDGGGYFPLDEKLGIEKRHTPGCQYFLSSFTGREAYEKSLGRFHEIFRPDGRERISMRKSLDMDAQLGNRLEEIRQEEIRQVYEHGEEVAAVHPIEGTIAVSADATKLRERGHKQTNDEGETCYPAEWRDVKVGSVSAVGWDAEHREAFCRDSSYVGGIEYADLFFKRLTVEVMRRTPPGETPRLVFLADGAQWIWDRFAEMAGEDSVFILDYYHAGEHVSDLCKCLYGEQTVEYWRQFKEWKTLLWNGGVERFLEQVRTLRDAPMHSTKRDAVQKQLNYFEENKERMHYDRYRAEKLPIGSGTIESACKNVIGGRMKQGGMSWSERGAEGMVQICTSLSSGRHLSDFLATLDRAA